MNKSRVVACDQNRRRMHRVVQAMAATVLLCAAYVQARAADAAAPIGPLTSLAPPARSDALRLFGDYFFSPQGTLAHPALGWRASSGLARPARPVNLFGTPFDTPPSQAYLGLGYSQLWLHSQLSLNADLGLASQAAGNFSQLRDVLSGSQTLDDAVRSLRWGPVMAVKVDYTF